MITDAGQDLDDEVRARDDELKAGESLFSP
jgi:hypothetical protein